MSDGERRPAFVRPGNPLTYALLSALLLPSRLGGRDLDWAFGLALVALALWILPFQPSPWEARRPSAQAAVFFAALTTLSAVSWLYSTAFNGVATGLADALALGRSLAFGAIAVYVIRHFDGEVRAAMNRALPLAPWLYLALYGRGYVDAGFALAASTTALIWSLFFSTEERKAALAVGAGPALAALAYGASLWSQPRPRASDVLVYIRRSPVFGWGPASYDLLPVPANQYLDWLLHRGALGTAVVAAGLAYVLFRAVAYAWDAPDRRTGVVAASVMIAALLTQGRFAESPRLFFLGSLLAAAAGGGR